MNDVRVGSVIANKYQLLRLLGHGSMGSIYEAIHTDIGKRVAIKLIHPSYTSDEDTIRRFRREARAAAAAASEHIVQVYDMGYDALHGHFMVQEYLIGEDLEARLAREGTLDVRTAVLVGIQVARGLSVAHRVGVVHRDLKPANVFLASRDGGEFVVKILDFGISKLRDLGDASTRSYDNLTGPGVTLGTPQYMSPEQVEGERDIDARADIWSLSSVLYEALSGRSPYAHRSYMETMLSILRETPKSIIQVAPWVPEAVANVIHGGLVIDREERISSASKYERFLSAAHSTLSAVPAPRHSFVQPRKVGRTNDGTTENTSADLEPETQRSPEVRSSRR